MRQIVAATAALAATVAFLYMLTGAITDPTYQGGLTARYQAQQQTKQIEAREWGATARIWGMWGLAACAFVGGVGLASWAVVEWQRNRTARATVYEEQTTERLRITAKKEIGLAWIAQFGVPERDSIGTHGGQLGVFTVEDGTPTFVTIDACRAELAAAQGTALARRTPQTINVPPVAQERKFLISGERQEWNGEV